MKIVLLLLALVGYVYSTSSISSSNCVNGRCVSCDNNGCRETRSAEAETELIRCTCQGTYCRKCYSFRCITVENCDSKRKRAAIDLPNRCFCISDYICQLCDFMGCRMVKYCDSKFKRTAVEQSIAMRCSCSLTDPSGCEICDRFGCNKISYCPELKRKRTAVEQWINGRCTCSPTDPSDCKQCDAYGCQKTRSAEAETELFRCTCHLFQKMPLFSVHNSPAPITNYNARPQSTTYVILKTKLHDCMASSLRQGHSVLVKRSVPPRPSLPRSRYLTFPMAPRNFLMPTFRSTSEI